MADQSLADVYPDAVAAYENAMTDAVFARAQWVEKGRPLVQENGNGTAGVHPLLKAMQDSEGLAHRYRVELGLSPRSAKTVVKRGPGRPVGATSAADREPPKVSLRSVG